MLDNSPDRAQYHSGDRGGIIGKCLPRNARFSQSFSILHIHITLHFCDLSRMEVAEEHKNNLQSENHNIYKQNQAHEGKHTHTHTFVIYNKVKLICQQHVGVQEIRILTFAAYEGGFNRT